MAACIAPNVIYLASSSGGGRPKPQTAARTGLISLPVKPSLSSKRSFSLPKNKSVFSSLAARARRSETSTGMPVQFKESPAATTSEETSTNVSQQLQGSLVPTTSQEPSTDATQQLDEFPLASTSEETSTGVTQQLEDLREETSKENSVAISQQSEASPEGEEKNISDTSEQFDNLLNDLKNKFDAIEDKSTVLIYGSAAVATLWVSGAVVDAINSIPLFPKVMEFVGFGYTVWFVYRYLLFKKSREELVATFEELKQKITG